MSGWTAVTLHFEDDERASEVDEQLREDYTGRRPWSATGYAECTVQVERGAKHGRVAQQFAEEYPDADTIAVVAANDTSDSGRGTLYSVEDGDIEKIDSKSGYEGAKGRDVTGYFRDEHGVESYASWEA